MKTRKTHDPAGRHIMVISLLIPLNIPAEITVKVDLKYL